MRTAAVLAGCGLLATAFVPSRVAASLAAAGAMPSYDVQVAIDFDAGIYAGTERVRYTNRTGQSLDELFFNLYPNAGAQTLQERLLIVHAVRSGDQQLQFVNFRRGIRVRLARKLRPGESADLELDFRGRAVARDPEDIGLAAHVTDQVAIVLAPEQRRSRSPGETTTLCGDALLLGNPFPMLSVERDDGWDGEARAGGIVLAEAATWRIAVDSEEGVDVVASGTPASGDTETGTRVFAGDGLRSVAVFATRGYVRKSVETAGVRVTSVSNPVHEKAAGRALDIAARGLELYAEEFGKPPFPELVIAEAPLAAGHPSEAFSGLVAVASAYYTDQSGPEGADLPGFIRDTPNLAEGEMEFAVLGDVARQWWGEAVGSDPQADAFLSEGLSSFSAVWAIGRIRGDEAADRAVEMRFRTPYRVFRMFGGQDAEANRRAGEFPNYFAYSATVQTKAGLFVESLSDEFGNERMREGLRQFYEVNSGRIASLGDLRRAIVLTGNRTGTRKVNWLYGRWIEQRHGDEDIAAPDYSVAVPEDVAGTRDTTKRKSGVERFGRFIVRQFAFVGKQVAKPF